MSSAIELVQRQVDAFNARDTDAFLACYATDATIRHGDGRVLMTGHEEMRAFYGPVFDDPQLRAEIAGRLHTGEWVVDEERTVGTGSSFHGLVAYQVRGDRIHTAVLLGDLG